jgi:hypothetical protein
MNAAHVEAYPRERPTLSLGILRVSHWQQCISNTGEVAGISMCNDYVPTRVAFQP